MKEQCDQAKSFWKLWIGRQCGKCSRFHLTEEEIEILKEHKENFEDVSLDVIFSHPLIHHATLHCISSHFKNYRLIISHQLLDTLHQITWPKTDDIHSQEHFSPESTNSSPSTLQTAVSTTRPAEYALNGARCTKWPCSPWTSRRNIGTPQEKGGWRFGITSARPSSWAWRWTILLR
jgi:hypothetical protein